MIRVGFVVDHFEVGGQEMACLELLRRLDRTRFRPYLYAFRPGELLGQVRRLRVPVLVGHDKPGRDRTWTARDSAARRAFRGRLAAALRADAIDVCLVHAWPDGVEAAREAGVRAVVERVDGPSLVGRVADKAGCDRIICQSRAIRDLLRAQRWLLRCRTSRIRVIPNAVDASRFDPARYDRAACRRRLGLGADTVAVGAVGRLAPEKNLGHLLEAVGLLVAGDREAARRVAVLLVGPDGGVRGELSARARRLGLSGRVRFLGARLDIPEILRALDVYALTSLCEGVPRALLEAMAMGLPVVATQIPSITEVVDGNGYLVSVLAPQDTRAALAALVRDAALRERLGRRSRRLAGRYGLDDMARRYEAVLLEALAGAGPRPRRGPPAASPAAPGGRGAPGRHRRRPRPPREERARAGRRA